MIKLKDTELDELFLNYYTPFYDWKFITRNNSNKGIIERFESILNSYFFQVNLKKSIYLLLHGALKNYIFPPIIWGL